RPIFCELSIRETPLATLIHQRRLTPSCEGQAPTAERTVGPARMIAESLTPKPGIREQSALLGLREMSGLSPQGGAKRTFDQAAHRHHPHSAERGHHRDRRRAQIPKVWLSNPRCIVDNGRALSTHARVPCDTTQNETCNGRATGSAFASTRSSRSSAI